MDRVVGALVSAIASLETLAEMYPHEHMVINALEEIAFRLGQMTEDERRTFDAAISRIAATQDQESPGTGDWVRSVPRRLGLT